MITYNINSPLNRTERTNLNDTLADILSKLTTLQRQINIITGDVNLDELITRLQNVVDDSELRINNSIQSNTDNTNQLLDEIRSQLVVVNTKITESDVATSNSIAATELANQTVTLIDDLLSSLVFRGLYSDSINYQKNNFVRYFKDTYVSLVDQINVTPNDDGVNWRLVAVGGVDGMGSVVSVNGKGPDSNGHVTLMPLDIGAVSSGQLTETNNNVSTLQQLVTTHIDEAIVKVGNQSIRGSLLVTNGLNIEDSTNYIYRENDRLVIRYGTADNIRYLFLQDNGSFTLPSGGIMLEHIYLYQSNGLIIRTGVSGSERFFNFNNNGDFEILNGRVVIGSISIISGSVNPEGTATANAGSLYIDALNGKLYQKTSGTGNTGWVEK